jgi:DMSO/TMAO reductase YedYZ molybdopterin-dependent catalytic subunit
MLRTTRRQLFKLLLMYGAVYSALRSRVVSGLSLFGSKAAKRIVAKGTPLSSLIHADPAELDARNLATSSMEVFDVMGDTVYRVDLQNWRLAVDGAVQRPSEFTYEELVARPSIERNVLLICPGFFAYNGKWKGFSVARLLEEVGFDPRATHIKFSGLEGIRRNTKRYKIEDVNDDRLFLAYRVNGEPLPERHGFPLRLVAEGHKGRRWVKYVNRIVVVS